MPKFFNTLNKYISKYFTIAIRKSTNGKLMYQRSYRDEKCINPIEGEIRYDFYYALLDLRIKHEKNFK